MRWMILLSLAVTSAGSIASAQEPSDNFIEMMQMLGQKAVPDAIDLDTSEAGSVQFEQIENGSICYIGPCDRPLDGTRLVCYRDSIGGCDDCNWEHDNVCDP